jgi:hypothetical protein
VYITRPGGEVLLAGATRAVSVAGYPRLAPGMKVQVTLVAVPEAESYQEVSLTALAGKGE